MTYGAHEMKVCSKCKVEKDESEFYKQKVSKDGLTPYCKQCSNQAAREWKKNNKEKYSEITRRYYDKNKEKILKESKLWRENNLEKAREAVRIYAKNNPEKIKEHGSKYRNKHREEAIARTKKWREENPEKDKAKNQRVMKNLYDSYVSLHLVQMGFPRESITPELIEFKRIQLKIKRLIKEKGSA